MVFRAGMGSTINLGHHLRYSEDYCHQGHGIVSRRCYRKDKFIALRPSWLDLSRVALKIKYSRGLDAKEISTFITVKGL